MNISMEVNILIILSINFITWKFPPTILIETQTHATSSFCFTALLIHKNNKECHNDSLIYYTLMTIKKLSLVRLIETPIEKSFFILLTEGDLYGIFEIYFIFNMHLSWF